MSTIYFISSSKNNTDAPVKIGKVLEDTVAAVESRLKQLQTGHPHKLRLLAIYKESDLITESRLHQHFRKDKISGEWFTMTQDLADIISLCSMETDHRVIHQRMMKGEPVVSYKPSAPEVAFNKFKDDQIVTLSHNIKQKLVYSVDEAAKHLGISRAALYLELRDGVLPARKLRNRTIILADDLHEYILAAPVYIPASKNSGAKNASGE